MEIELSGLRLFVILWNFSPMLHPNELLSIVLKSGLFSSNTQLGVIGFVHWGVKELTESIGPLWWRRI